MRSLTNTIDMYSERFGFSSARIFRWIVAALIIGISVRYVLGVLFTYSMDTDYWILVNDSITSGNGLYGLPGYYYTPVWGYFLAFLNPICGFLGINTGHMTNAYVSSSYMGAYAATYPSLSYALIIKTMLILFDVLVGYFIFKIVMEMKHNERDAAIAFMFWFLCPLTILISSCRIMFENLEILFLLASFYMMLKKRPCMSGILIALSLLTKPYGIFFAAMMIGFSYAQCRDAKYTAEFILATFAAGVITVLPTILSGNLDLALYWLTNRTGGSSESGYSEILNLFPLLLLGSIAASAAIALKKIDDPRVLMCLALFFQAGMLVYPGNIQYYLMYVPFMALLCGKAYLPVQIPFLFLLVFGILTEPIYNTIVFIGSGLPGEDIMIGFTRWMRSLNMDVIQDVYLLLKHVCTMLVLITPFLAFILRSREGGEQPEKC